MIYQQRTYSTMINFGIALYKHRLLPYHTKLLCTSKQLDCFNWLFKFKSSEWGFFKMKQRTKFWKIGLCTFKIVSLQYLKTSNDICSFYHTMSQKSLKDLVTSLNFCEVEDQGQAHGVLGHELSTAHETQHCISHHIQSIQKPTIIQHKCIRS